ncbi:MAG TPA: hypothetical protein VK195_06095, partial [Burkholderiaceae bacterium]|nr:hypothetical protein [Burkholderiaceae bacterium]
LAASFASLTCHQQRSEIMTEFLSYRQAFFEICFSTVFNAWRNIQIPPHQDRNLFAPRHFYATSALLLFCASFRSTASAAKP